MTQRIFDTDNEEDMKLLWSIVPDDVERIKKNEPNTEYCAYIYPDSSLFITNMLKVNWHDKTEITRPVNYKDMVGCVGWFWDSCEDEIKLGILIKVEPNNEEGYCFIKDNNVGYKNFSPAKKSELKFWEE